MKETHQFTIVRDKGESLPRTTKPSTQESVYRKHTGTHLAFVTLPVCWKGPEIANTGK